MAKDAIAIGTRLIGQDQPPCVVAEIGQNHNGSVYTAVRMIGMAVECGADFVKFQLRRAELEFTAAQLDAPHPNPSAAFGATYREHRKALDLTTTDLEHIDARIKYNQWPIQWYATPCYLEAVEELESLGVPAYKIASKDLTNLPLIDEAASTGKPIVLSTGMATMQEIDAALDAVFEHHDKVIVLQCTSQYPCDNRNVHLLAMLDIAEAFDVLVGVSDHTVGIQVPLMAVTLGAVMVEKHITLCRAMPGTDHAAAVEKDGLARIVRDCYEADKILGRAEKLRVDAVEPFAVKLSGSLVAARPIGRGETIGEADLRIKAPGDGLKWSQRALVVGHVARRDMELDEQIRTTDVI